MSGGGLQILVYACVAQDLFFFKPVGHIRQACVAYDARFLIHACVCWRSLFTPLAAHCPRADGAKRRARVLIPPGYLHPGKRKH
jgi:hypothetical protein